jgi:hypothetical protein
MVFALRLYRLRQTKGCRKGANRYYGFMSYRTVEVELENGHVRPRGLDSLPPKSYALLTLLDETVSETAQTCRDLARRWKLLEKLPEEEAAAFADDIEIARSKLPSLQSKWD